MAVVEKKLLFPFSLFHLSLKFVSSDLYALLVHYHHDQSSCARTHLSPHSQNIINRWNHHHSSLLLLAKWTDNSGRCHEWANYSPDRWSYFQCACSLNSFLLFTYTSFQSRAHYLRCISIGASPGILYSVHVEWDSGILRVPKAPPFLPRLTRCLSYDSIKKHQVLGFASTVASQSSFLLDSDITFLPAL